MASQEQHGNAEYLFRTLLQLEFPLKVLTVHYKCAQKGLRHSSQVLRL